MKPMFKINFKHPCTPIPYATSKQSLERMYIRTNHDENYSTPMQFLHSNHRRDKSQPCHSSPPEIIHIFRGRRIPSRWKLEATQKINASIQNAQLLQEKRKALSQINSACIQHITKKELYKLPPKKLIDIIHLRKISQAAMTIWKHWRLFKVARMYAKMKSALVASTTQIQAAWRKHYRRITNTRNRIMLLNKMSNTILQVIKAYKLNKYFQNSTIKNKLVNNITLLEQWGYPHKEKASQVIIKAIKSYLFSKQINEVTSSKELEGKKVRRMSDCILDIKRSKNRGEILKRPSLFRNHQANPDFNSDLITLKM